MQMAGIFFIVLGLLKKLKLNYGTIFIISVALNIMGVIFSGKIETGNYVLDQLIGLFIFTNSESYFPFFSWMIYPAFGMIAGKVLRHVADKKKFYGLLIGPACLLWILYYAVGINIDQPFFRVFIDWKSMCYVNIFDAAAHFICCIGLAAIWYFISLRASERVVSGAGFVSKNINRYYCVHLVLINIFLTFLELSGHGKLTTSFGCYFTAFVIIVLTTVILKFYINYWAAAVNGFIAKNRAAIRVAIVVLSVIACCWAFAGSTGGDIPNLTNDYFM